MTAELRLNKSLSQADHAIRQVHYVELPDTVPQASLSLN